MDVKYMRMTNGDFVISKIALDVDGTSNTVTLYEPAFVVFGQRETEEPMLQAFIPYSVDDVFIIRVTDIFVLSRPNDLLLQCYNEFIDEPSKTIH